MQFVNKHLGIIWGNFRALLQAGFFFCFEIDIIIKRILLNFLVGIFDLLRDCEDMDLQTLPCASFNTTPRFCRFRTDYRYIKSLPNRGL
jgi:hypothetical protein